jgi:hypothetical protein
MLHDASCGLRDKSGLCTGCKKLDLERIVDGKAIGMQGLRAG